MPASSHRADAPRLQRPALNPYALVLLVVVLAVIGGALVLRFADIQENRELMLWQNKLNLIADSRAADLDSWLDRYFKELGAVAANPSLQLYLTDLLNNEGIKKTLEEEPAQATFLQNLLSITADRLGFAEQPSPELQSINADVRQPSGVGLAILDNNGKIIVSTAGLPALGDALATKLAEAPKDRPSLIDLFTTASGQTHIGFTLPIYAIQGAATTQAIGRLVGIKTIDGNFFKLLQHPGVTEKTLEAVLMRRDGDNVVYLSPTKDSQPLAARFALNTAELDAAYAVLSPGNFAVKRDRQSHTTLMTSRTIVGAPWIMMVHVDRDQALAESVRWRRQTEAIMFFGLLAIVGGIVALWYYERSRLAMRLAAQEKLLRVVTDNQPQPILIVDQVNVAHFANIKAANAFHMPPADVVGKELAALIGTARAKEYNEANQAALQSGETITRTWRMESASGLEIIQSQHTPLEQIPIDTLPVPSPGVLIVDQDVTEIVTERERSARTLQKLINVLVHIVDNRDPYAGHHSASVALIAHEVAADMGFDSTLVETAETAGKLMNIGKIIVPHDLLTKTSALTTDEIKFVRESLQRGADLIQGIEFDGPVVDTLRQVQERYDGTGPLGLKGDNILITARIVAAANAFVGMVSPRSYHAAMSTDQAIKNLLKDAGAQFDNRVVIALANFIENKHGQETLKWLATNL